MMKIRPPNLKYFLTDQNCFRTNTVRFKILNIYKICKKHIFDLSLKIQSAHYGCQDQVIGIMCIYTQRYQFNAFLIEVNMMHFEFRDIMKA